MPSVAHQPPRTARANGIDICYEIFGDADAEPMMLIMGLGAQMVLWDDAFCERLAARGFRVIRFDNRDIGQSSQLTGGKRLTPFELLKLRFLKIPVAAPYKLRDMAEDRDSFRPHPEDRCAAPRLEGRGEPPRRQGGPGERPQPRGLALRDATFGASSEVRTVVYRRCA